MRAIKDINMSTISNLKTAIISKLIAAAKESTIHPEMVDELNKLSTGDDPRDLIGIRWYDLMSFDRTATELCYIVLFNQLAIECN